MDKDVVPQAIGGKNTLCDETCSSWAIQLFDFFFSDLFYLYCDYS